MLYLKWAAFLLPSFLMEIVGKVGAPILSFLCVQTGGCRIGCGGFSPPTTVATGTKATVPDGRETGGFGRGRDGRRGCSATRRMDSTLTCSASA